MGTLFRSVVQFVNSYLLFLIENTFIRGFSEENFFSPFPDTILVTPQVWRHLIWATFRVSIFPCVQDAFHVRHVEAIWPGTVRNSVHSRGQQGCQKALCPRGTRLPIQWQWREVRVHRLFGHTSVAELFSLSDPLGFWLYFWPFRLISVN